MSAPLAGKFQDHYLVLGVDPRADMQTIQQTYKKLVSSIHPNTTLKSEKEKLDTFKQAFEVLSDPALRAEFDKLKGLDPEAGGPRFSGDAFFESLGREADLRSALLCVLYDRRRAKPSTPSLSLRQLEGILEAKSDELTFTIWYLKQRSLVLADDKSSLQITVDGMDFLERLRPAATQVMRLIRPAAIANPRPAPTPEPDAAGGVRALASVLSAHASEPEKPAETQARPVRD